MQTTQDWSIEWATFFDEYAGDFHPSFKSKFAKQLFEKGSAETGIHGFEKHDFQILVGQENLKMQQIEGNMFALVSFCTPPCMSDSVWVYWTAEGQDVSHLHTQDVSDVAIEFHWGGNFPIGEILPYLKPYKKRKKIKTGFHFDVEYYHNAFPAISFELVSTHPFNEEQTKAINDFIGAFVSKWNYENKEKTINHVSPLIVTGENKYEIVADFGLTNSMDVIDHLLKELSTCVSTYLIHKILIR